MLSEVSNFRVKQFANERDMSSILYEVKRTRAVFDDSLAIPGTNRRGGWRCPPGTRYGGQITDRFGRNCGWGVSRRIANEISDLGERLENVGDRRRGRRAGRAAGRVNRPGLIERAAGGVARALDTNETDGKPDLKPAARVRRGGARKPRLRDSELRRMDREIDQPNAPRTGDVDVQPARRPRPAAPAARRRPAARQVTREKPQSEVVDAPEAPAPTKKAPVKKAAAKKKAVKKKAPAKKAAARRVTPAAGGNDEPPKLVAKPKTPAPKPEAAEPEAPDAVREKIRAAGFIGVGNEPLSADEISRFAGVGEADFNAAQREVEIGRENVSRDMDQWTRDNIKELRGVVENQNRYVDEAQRDLQDALDRMRTGGPDASSSDFKTLQEKVIKANRDYAMAIHRREAFTNRLEQLNRVVVNPVDTPNEALPPMDNANALRIIFAGRPLGFERDWQNERQRILDLDNDFSAMNEADALDRISNFDAALNWNQEYLRNLEALDPNQRIQLPNRVVKAGDLKDEVQGVVNAWQSLKDGANARLAAINADRLPGLHGIRALSGQNLEGFASIERARTNLDRLVTNYPGTRFSVINHNGKFIVVSQDQLNRALLNGLDNPNIVERKGGLPLAEELPPIDSDIARQAKERVDKAIQKRQDILADYLNDRYGAGNAPWKEMTAERRIDLAQRAAQGDEAAKRALLAWAKAMYDHPEIKGTNGKTYRVVARPNYRGSSIYVTAIIERKNADGTWLQVGESERTIHHGEDPAFVYNNRMFITNPADKNNGIQTVYNQHAFMYGQAAGFKYFQVSAAADGPYVWGRIGFTERIHASNVANMNNEIAKFRSGGVSIIKNETDARILEHVVGDYIRNPDKVRHLDFIAALSIEGTGQAKKDRDAELRNWFVANMGFSSGKLDLNANNIVVDPRERVGA